MCCLNGWLRNMVLLRSFMHKEQIEGPENDHATRKSHEHIDWVRALGLLLCKEDQLNVQNRICKTIGHVVLKRLA
jgi:hypothetical protein